MTFPTNALLLYMAKVVDIRLELHISISECSDPVILGNGDNELIQHTKLDRQKKEY